MSSSPRNIKYSCKYWLPIIIGVVRAFFALSLFWTRERDAKERAKEREKAKEPSTKEKQRQFTLFLPSLHNTGSLVSEPKAARRSCPGSPVLAVSDSPVLEILNIPLVLLWIFVQFSAYLSLGSSSKHLIQYHVNLYYCPKNGVREKWIIFSWWTKPRVKSLT